MRFNGAQAKGGAHLHMLFSAVLKSLSLETYAEILVGGTSEGAVRTGDLLVGLSGQS